jgi:hypothetical protein
LFAAGRNGFQHDPFVKTLFGDAWNIAGVALVVAVAAGLTGAGEAGLGGVRHAGRWVRCGRLAGASLTLNGSGER